MRTRVTFDDIFFKIPKNINNNCIGFHISSSGQTQVNGSQLDWHHSATALIDPYLCAAFYLGKFISIISAEDHDSVLKECEKTGMTKCPPNLKGVRRWRAGRQEQAANIIKISQPTFYKRDGLLEHPKDFGISDAT